jgi:hypothetical protein
MSEPMWMSGDDFALGLDEEEIEEDPDTLHDELGEEQ